MPNSIALELLVRAAAKQFKDQGHLSDSLGQRMLGRIRILESTLLRLTHSADADVSRIATEALGEMSE